MFCHNNKAFLFSLPKRCIRSRSRLFLRRHRPTKKSAPALHPESVGSRRLRLRNPAFEKKNCLQRIILRRKSARPLLSKIGAAYTAQPPIFVDKHYFRGHFWIILQNFRSAANSVRKNLIYLVRVICSMEFFAISFTRFRLITCALYNISQYCDNWLSNLPKVHLADQTNNRSIVNN